MFFESFSRQSGLLCSTGPRLQMGFVFSSVGPCALRGRTVVSAFLHHIGNGWRPGDSSPQDADFIRTLQHTQ
jgi:hypothetical protein